MSKKFDSSDKKNVVVVGGGYAGVNTVKALAKMLDSTRFNLVLVTSKPYFVHLVAAIRLTVANTDDLINTALIPYDRLQGVTHRVAVVTAIEEKAPGKDGSIVLENGERIPYAALVLATGSLWPGPIDLGNTDEEIHQSVKLWRSRYAKAKHVVIVGGGAVGIGMSAYAQCFIAMRSDQALVQKPSVRSRMCIR